MPIKKVGIHKQGEISLQDLLTEIRKDPRTRKAGAIACFIGVVREEGLKGKVRYLEYEAYNEVVEKQLESIRKRILEKYGLIDLYIHHNVDRIPVGEDAVYVIAIGRHRKETFDALKETMDKVKEEAAIWKKEVTEKEAYWVPG